MPTETFERSLDVAADRATAWRTITDVPTLVSWVSLLHEAEVVAELERYHAVLEDRLGRFRLKAGLDITVVEHEEPARIVVHAEGEDQQVASRIVVDATVDLHEREGGSTLQVAGRYEVSGRVATLGSGTIRKKAGRILDEFFASVEQALG